MYMICSKIVTDNLGIGIYSLAGGLCSIEKLRANNSTREFRLPVRARA